MTSAANTTDRDESAARLLVAIDAFADDNYRRLDDNHEPRQMRIKTLATTGRSSCRRPAILVDVDHLVPGVRHVDRLRERHVTLGSEQVQPAFFASSKFARAASS